MLVVHEGYVNNDFTQKYVNSHSGDCLAVAPIAGLREVPNIQLDGQPNRLMATISNCSSIGKATKQV